MDNLIGQRFSLISKSEIRYVGTLHEINPQESTIALEEVFSFGTEDRKVDNFIAPSQQKYDYIIFRGTDVKDIKLAEDNKENKQPSPPQPPNDPAILNSSRPGPPLQGPPPPGPPSHRGESPYPPSQGYPPQGQFQGFYPPPPPPGHFGRGYPPPPPHGGFGPGQNFYHPPPPPGYYGPPGHGFGPGPNQFPRQQQQQQPPPPQQQQQPQPQQQQQQPPQPPPIGPPGQRQPPQHQAPPSTALDEPSGATSELPVEKAASRDGSKAPTPIPVPTATMSAPQQPQPPSNAVPAPTAPQQPAVTQAPPQPKNNRVTPAVPLMVNQRTFTPPVQPGAVAGDVNGGTTKPAVKSQASMEEASKQAREAVAAAMAKLNPTTSVPKPTPSTDPVGDITKGVGAISTGPAMRGRGAYRGGRGARSSSGGQRPKMEIPQSDFDFESANAKFNKEDLIKEAIASGSPLGEKAEEEALADGPANGNTPARKDSLNSAPAYNKSTSFFDNISSEARDRVEGSENNNARTVRGQEFKKNVETFGQGNVDSSYHRGRGGYRAGRRGGRGYRGFNRGARGTPAGQV